MRIAVIGAGQIGGNIASRLSSSGHEVTVSFARNPDNLEALAASIGASVASPADAVTGADVVVISVPWRVIPAALAEAGPLVGKVVIDTTNQFGAELAENQTAAAFNAMRMAGARYTKSFNTLTATFQAQTAERPVGKRVVQWLCGDDVDAKEIVASLIRDAGYEPVDVGGVDACTTMEAPRRAGAVYGEEYRRAEAEAAVRAINEGSPIPPPPQYEGV